MNDQEILAGLGEIVEEIAGVPADEVTPSKSFVDDLDIDSLSMVEIAVAAQDKFGVEIPDDQLKDLNTVQDVVNFVSQERRRVGVTAGRETVVVTGLGATTPLGGDVASTWSAMLAGRSGVRQLTQPWAEDLPVRIAAAAAADPVEIVGRVQARRMDRCEQLALVAAAREAWADAGTPEVDPERLGVAVTTGIGGIGSTADRVRHAQGEGLAAHLAVHGSDAHAERLGRLDQHGDRRSGGCARPGQRLRVRRRGDRLRHRHDPLRAAPTWCWPAAPRRRSCR